MVIQKIVMNEDDVINLKRDIKLNNIITVIIMERIPTLIYGRDRNMFIGGNYKLLLTGYVHDSSYILHHDVMDNYFTSFSMLVWLYTCVLVITYHYSTQLYIRMLLSICLSEKDSINFQFLQILSL